MLNHDLARAVEANGRTYGDTEIGACGHAVYGPYEDLAPGAYGVDFTISLLEARVKTSDAVCALVDVVADGGRKSVAYDFVSLSDLRDGAQTVTLRFRLADPAILEFRVHVNGVAALRIDANPEARPLTEAALERASTMPFPEEQIEERAFLHRLYREERGLARHAGGWIAQPNGIVLNANTADDVNFVREIFEERAYNILGTDDCCVFDIGMNVGLASLFFAAKPQVREVHAFEPFESTFTRAVENFALNPQMAAKITPHNFGLAGRDQEAILKISPNAGDSGGMRIYEDEDGEPTRLVVRDAVATLAPIMAGAVERSLRVVVKIDCEGAEFEIFEVLDQAGLLPGISALMVEWHRCFPNKDETTLIEPLLRAGFLVIDRSPPSGNGFFYAIRPAPLKSTQDAPRQGSGAFSALRRRAA